MNALAPVAGKLAKLLRLLSSDHDAEVLGAARAIMLTLKRTGTDIHTLADQIERPNSGGLTEAEMKKLYDAGFAAGMRAAGDNGFHSVEEPGWYEIACECATHPERLRGARERQFVQDMVRRTVRGGEPTEKQAKWLRAIYVRVRR